MTFEPLAYPDIPEADAIELEGTLEYFYGEHTIHELASIIHKVMEDLGTENLIVELQKLV